LLLLSPDDNTKALLLEAGLFYGEVDNGYFGGDLWRVMRIAVSRRDVQLEFGIVFNLFIADFDAERLSDLDQGLAEHVVEDWIHFLANIDEEHLVSIANAELNVLNALWIFRIGNDERVAVGLLYPIHCLSLWINIESPSQTFSHEDSVFSREFVSWKTVDLPLSSLGSAGHEIGEIKALREWNLILLDERNPVGNELISEVRWEWSAVTHESSC
jgi:hypothetical protein